MNVAASLKKNASLSILLLDQFFHRRDRVTLFLWAFLPFFLLLNHVGVNFLNPSTFTKFLPFFSMLSLGMIYSFRLKGFLIVLTTFVCLLFFSFSYLQSEGYLWHFTSFCSLALTFFIAFLSFEEALVNVDVIYENERELSRKLCQKEIDFQRMQKSFEEMEIELQEEIEKLKQESQLRQIEKKNEEKYLLLVQSEIELLTMQKNSFVETAWKAEENASLQIQLLNDYQKQSQALLDQQNSELIYLKKLQEQLEKELSVVTEKAEKEALDHSQRIDELKSKFFQENQVAKKEIACQKQSLEEMHMQWNLELHQANVKLNHLETLLTVEKKQSQQQQVELTEQVRHAEQLFLEKQAIEVHYSHLIEQHKQELVKLQEQLVAVQQQSISSTLPSTQEEYKQLQQQYALLESSTNQLRSQFREKSQILSQTRKELFALETKVLAFDKQKTWEDLEISSQELYLEKEIMHLCKEVEELEHEVILLEKILY